MSLFAGLARQAAALPPVQQLPAPQRGRGLIGGARPSVNMGEALGFLIGGPRYVGNMRQGQRDDAAAQQAARLAEQQRAQREQYAATIQDPRERQLFMSAPDEWAKNVGQQFAPQVVSAGAAQVVNGARTVEQPTYSESGDTILERSSAGVNPVFTRTTPSISEETAQTVAETGRINATNPMNVAPGNSLIRPLTGEVVAQTPDAFSLSPGEQRFTGGGLTAQNTAPRPLPDAIRKDNEADEMAIGEREAVVARVDNAINLIQNGMINLDPASRASAWFRNNTGNSSPQSQAQAELRRTVESLRNSILNDATGPQTDGDSLRALNQIIQGWGDEQVVMQGLQEYRDIQARKTATQRQIMQQRAAQYGGAQAQPQGAPQGQPQGGAPSRAALEAEARRRGLL